MQIIKIEPYDNGGHANQNSGLKTVPEGWAMVPADLATPNFPFGEVTTETVDGVVTVMTWEALPIPEPEEPEPTETEQMRADIDYIAAMTGVDLV